jgi:hypothetical protein
MLFSLARQHIASTLVWSVVWPYLTLGVSSRDFIAMPRKTPIKLEHDPTVGSRVIDLLSQYSGLARPDVGVID